MRTGRIVLALVVCLQVCFSLAVAAEPSATELYERARKAEKAGQTVEAYLLYAEAAAKDPQNLQYWTRAQALRPLASLQIKTSPDLKFQFKPDPSIAGVITDRELAQARRPLPPVEMAAASGDQDFDLNGDSKALFEKVGAAFGIKTVFDPAYQPASGVQFHIHGVDWREALRALEAATGSFVFPLGTHMMMVANDTPAKRTEFEPNAAIAIPIPDILSVQEAQEAAAAVRGTLDLRKLTVDAQRRMILIRDRASRVRAAEALLYDLMRQRTKIAIDVDFMTADDTSDNTWGLDLPTSFPLVSFGSALSHFPKNILTSVPAGFTRFLAFGGGASFLGLGMTDATLFATTSKSTARTLLHSEIVSLDGEAATLHIGDKYPIVTSAFFSSGSNTSGFATTPQFNFEDLGLALKVTPRAHGRDEVSLEVEAEYKLLGAQSVNGIPVISARKFQSKIRLRTGEWAVIAGLVSESDIKSITGIPGLSLIPFLRKNDTQHSRSDTLIVLKPRLLSMPPAESATVARWVGTETRPLSF